MRRIAIINQKGGVGKTTTSVNLGAALARAGKRVCILDLDPQAHATTHLGIEPDGQQPSMYDVLIDNKPLADVRRQVEDNLWLAGSDINLAAAEVELAGVVGREVILRDQLRRRGAIRFRADGLCPVARRVDAQRPVLRPTRSSFRCSRTSWRCTAWANCWRRRPWSPSASIRS